MSNNDWNDNSQWILKSVDALYLAVKENNEKIDEKYEALKDLINKNDKAISILKTDYENQVSSLKKDLSKRTTVMNIIGFVLLVIGNALYAILSK